MEITGISSHEANLRCAQNCNGLINVFLIYDVTLHDKYFV